MKTKIKNLVYGVAAFLMFAPVMAFAQLNVGSVETASGLRNQTVTTLVTNVMKWLLSIVGFLGVIGFAVAGILYITAAGNEDRIDQAKRAMTWSVVGVLVALLGLVIVNAGARLFITGDSQF